MDRLFEFIGNHWIMVAATAVVAVLLLQDLIESLTRKHRLVTPAAAVSLLNQDGSLLLDVREQHEFSEGHIVNAHHMPLGKIDERIGEIESFKNAPIIVTCQSGTRAPQACGKLVKAGFGHVHELQGGMVAWEEQKLPITRKRKK